MVSKARLPNLDTPPPPSPLSSPPRGDSVDGARPPFGSDDDSALGPPGSSDGTINEEDDDSQDPDEADPQARDDGGADAYMGNADEDGANDKAGRLEGGGEQDELA